jgi:hypothetical protein
MPTSTAQIKIEGLQKETIALREAFEAERSFIENMAKVLDEIVRAVKGHNGEGGLVQKVAVIDDLKTKVECLEKSNTDDAVRFVRMEIKLDSLLDTEKERKEEAKRLKWAIIGFILTNAGLIVAMVIYYFQSTPGG